MGRGAEQTFLQRRHKNSQKEYEKKFNKSIHGDM